MLAIQELNVIVPENGVTPSAWKIVPVGWLNVEIAAPGLAVMGGSRITATDATPIPLAMSMGVTVRV
jgi:hypothetical protein